MEQVQGNLSEDLLQLEAKVQANGSGSSDEERENDANVSDLEEMEEEEDDASQAGSQQESLLPTRTVGNFPVAAQRTISQRTQHRNKQ